MNYRHIYHAGNFADVVKHLTLIALLSCLKKKTAAFCCLDTHAGAGYYHLFSAMAEKTQEYKTGISKVIAAKNPPPLVKEYLHCLEEINQHFGSTDMDLSSKHLAYYPGSPLIARQLLRPQDRLIACELHREEHQALRSHFHGDKQAAIHHVDGWQALKAFLPPKEKRGLVFIDPPYENPDEWTYLAQHLLSALKQWETGIYAIWYPIKTRQLSDQLYQKLKQMLKQPIFSIEFMIFPETALYLSGCGLAIINPPWQFEEQLTPSLLWLHQILTTEITTPQHGGVSTCFIK